MPYVQEIVKAGKTIYVKKYYTRRYYSRAEKRRKKKEATSEQMMVINHRNRERKLTWILNDNFQGGDLHLRLSYTKENKQDDRKQMQQYIKKFLRDMRREYKKLGKDFKYVHVFEIGSKGARHHHLVINAVDTRVIRKCWPHGYIHTSLLDDSGEYSKLAAYLLKYSSKNIGKWMGQAYTKSRNLTIPTPVRKIISGRDMFREKVRAKKDYYIPRRLRTRW